MNRTRLNRRDILRSTLAGAAAVALPGAANAIAEARWTFPAPAIPSTLAGDQLAWALAQVNDAALSLTERELRGHFTDAFLSGLPPVDLLGVFRNYLAPNGPMQVARFEGAVTETRAQAILTAPGSDWRVTLAAEPGSGGISALFFEPIVLPQPLPKQITSWNPIARRLAKLAPMVSFFAGEIIDGKLVSLYEHEPDHTLSIASSFKLYVLAELGRQIGSGKASWDEPLAIRDDLRSLPNGLMRLEATGATFPIRHFAEQMISDSDNTATDHLIARLGRRNIERAFARYGNATPDRNIPLLMTREWFAMRMRLTAPEIEGYLAQDVAGKRAFLAGRIAAEANTLSEVEPWPGGFFLDRIEWFASAADLARVLTALHVMADGDGLRPIHDALSMNAGIAFDARTWAYVGYKAGYETGVKSNAWLLQSGDGRWFVLAALINDLQQEIDGIGLNQLVMPAVWLLANRA